MIFLDLFTLRVIYFLLHLLHVFYLWDKQHLNNKLLYVGNTQALFIILLIIRDVTEGKQLIQTWQAAKLADCNVFVVPMMCCLDTPT